MRFLRGVLTVLLLPFLIGCPSRNGVVDDEVVDGVKPGDVKEKIKEIRVKVRLEDDPNRPGRQRVVIDETVHDTVAVVPGDTLHWKCVTGDDDKPCEGMEFAVEGPRESFDLEHLAEMLSRRPSGDAAELQDELKKLGDELSLAYRQREGKPSRAPIEGKLGLRPLGDAIVITSDLQAPAEGPVEWAAGPGYVDASTPISTSGVVRGEIGHKLFKYTWRVRLKDDKESEDAWDPHVYGHPDGYRP